DIARRRDGTLFPAHFADSPVIEEGGQFVGFVSISSDITDRKQIEARLVHAALHDTLTGLPNRAYFFDRTRRALEAARQRKGTIAILFLDLDNFKDINDSFGHECGDELLVRVATVLQDSIDEDATVIRLGGDEFVILMEDVTDTGKPMLAADRVLAALGEPLELTGRHVIVSGSIGIVISAERHTQPEHLLRDADIAMYRAKDTGKNRPIVFEAVMHEDVVERLELESALREALEREEFVLQYQPKIALATGRMVGVEALLRWQHPRRGLIQPCIFIPLAERTGLIIKLGMWVLHEACRQGAKWCQVYDGPGPFIVSVNLSSHQFAQTNLVDQVRTVLEETGLPAVCLALEITESTVMDDARNAVGRLHELKSLGIQLGVDDFGTGYSSLAYLKRFPLDVLKIDRSFVNGLGRVPEDTAIVSAIITLAQVIGLGVVAEGVETPEQVQLLRDLGCERAQGFYFSRPIPDVEVTELLHGDRRLGASDSYVSRSTAADETT
ncbi:MAG TPA: EAL domain-containing protein, partial [Nitrolancea sp.]|nr:EAL domain-containing protein [Nitrolancea sp.]